MNINEYAAGGQALYQDFAEVVANILNQAIATATLKASRPQSQHRAKDAVRLRARLEESGEGEASNIEELRKDLAGCRLIFYSNGDLNEFLHSRILHDNFDIDYDSTKIHHPVSKDGSEPQYRGYNFVVRLKESRTSLPEYARFAGLRCEVQLQTILNHAWSETSHDIIYKRPLGTEFAKKALGQIEKRFRDIMLKYLVPAGHEFGKAKHDFESLMLGKPIFEKGPLLALKDAADNNERRDVLERIREHYLPNHDDPQPLVPELLATVEEAIDRSRGTPAARIITGAGEMDGWAGAHVIDAALDLLGLFPYADTEATFDLLVRLMKHAQEKEEKDRVLQSVESFAAVPLRVVRKVGGEVHLRLMRKLEGIEANERAQVRPLVIKVCEQVLKPDLAGTSSSYKTVTFEHGAMPATKEIEIARSKAIDLLMSLYQSSRSDTDRLVILQHLSSASQTPTQGQYTNALAALVMRDSLKVASFLLDTLASASFEVKKAIEHDAWNMYRTLCLTPYSDDDDTIKALQEKLRPAALMIRDALAADAEYEIFKTLVSLNSVYTPSWDTPKFDFRRDDAWRSQRIDAYLADFTQATADSWWARLERCASSESHDLAAHRGLQELLRRLCEEQPELVLERLDSLPGNVAHFLTLILTSLEKSSRKADLQPILEHWAKEGKHLRPIARHYRGANEIYIVVLSDVFKMAVKNGEHLVVVEIVASLVNVFGQPDMTGKPLLMEAIAWLGSQAQTDWMEEIWYMDKALPALAEGLTHNERVALLNALVPHTKADYHLDYLLSAFAAVDLPSVLEFFAARLRYAAAPPRKKNYEAIPYALTEFRSLALAPAVVLEAVLAWLRDGQREYEAVSFVHAVFPELSDELAAAMIKCAAKSKRDAYGILEMLSNYSGAERVFEICREIVGSLDPDDAELRRKIEFALNQSGTVTGEFGFVEVYKAKKQILQGWLTDSRTSVVNFAKKEIASLERTIASEQDRAEQTYALQKLNWGEPIDEDI